MGELPAEDGGRSVTMAEVVEGETAWMVRGTPARVAWSVAPDPSKCLRRGGGSGVSGWMQQRR